MTNFGDWGTPHYGLVLGRLQPLHLGHMEYFEATRKKSDHVVIGITNPDKNRFIHDSADPVRSLEQNNPFSYFDRYQMIATSLTDFGWRTDEFTIVPAPIDNPLAVFGYLPAPALTTAYITIYDKWGDRKADLMRDLGYPVEILWRRRMTDRLTSGTLLREAIRAGEPWRDSVPPAVARYLDQSGWTAALQSRSGNAKQSDPTIRWGADAH